MNELEALLDQVSFTVGYPAIEIYYRESGHRSKKVVLRHGATKTP